MSTPAWAFEDVRIVPADPAWAVRGDELCLALTRVLRPWLAPAGVVHVGSTAVPGLPAKPIIDVMAAVPDLGETSGADPALTIAAALEPSGWHYVPPALDGRPHRRFYVLVQDDRRQAHLHVMRPDEPRWAEQLVFRDRLRADADLARRYGDLKARLATEFAHDREGYSRAKTDFVRTVLTCEQ